MLLLYRAGHNVGKYVSLEKLIADSKESYYDALKASSAGWREGKNDDLPFVRYTLGVVAAAYREFSSRVKVLFSKELAKPDRVREIIRGTSGRITKAQIMELCPNISMRTDPARAQPPAGHRRSAQNRRQTLRVVCLEQGNEAVISRQALGPWRLATNFSFTTKTLEIIRTNFLYPARAGSNRS